MNPIRDYKNKKKISEEQISNGVKIIHKELASGRWQKLSLCEQLANIGSEVSRALRWRNKDKENFESAVSRALELFDLTLQDQRWKGRLREIGRAREVFLDAVSGGREYKSSLEGLERYFFYFAYCARQSLSSSKTVRTGKL